MTDSGRANPAAPNEFESPPSRSGMPLDNTLSNQEVGAPGFIKIVLVDIHLQAFAQQDQDSRRVQLPVFARKKHEVLFEHLVEVHVDPRTIHGQELSLI